MIIKLQRQICIHNQYGQPLFVSNIKEKETGKPDGFYVDFHDTGEFFIDYKDISISLKNLNLLANDLTGIKYKLDYKTQKLELEQVSKILNDLNGLTSKAIQSEDSRFNPKIAGIIYNKAYEDGHSSGVSNVICNCFDLVDMAKQILDAK